MGELQHQRVFEFEDVFKNQFNKTELGPNFGEMFFILANKKPTVVIEAFRNRPGNTEIYSAEVIGVTRFLCGQLELPLLFQQPMQAKGFFTDDKLKALDLYEFKEHDAKNRPHLRDACKHGLYCLAFNKEVERKYFNGGKR